jgi:hypothetical protein
MKGSNIIFNATKKANGVSKRVGNWSNLQEIKAKASTFDDPIQPVLKDLVKAGNKVNTNSRIKHDTTTKIF